jgi:hypothetical protein
MRRSNRWVPFLAALSVMGCSSSRDGNLILSTSGDPALGDGGVLPDAGTVADGGVSLCGRLTVDRVRMVVRSIELEPLAKSGMDGGVDAGRGDGGHRDDMNHQGGRDERCDPIADGGVVCVKPHGEVQIGPFLVDLSGQQLAGGIREAFDWAVPAGTYRQIKFAINTLSKPLASLSPGLAEMKALHASIAVDGFLDGKPFRFVTPMHLEQNREGTLQVGPGTANITLVVDPRGWFVGGQGQILDPRDRRDRGDILEAIRCSIRMFPDKDRKGDEDWDGGDDHRGDDCDCKCVCGDEHHDCELGDGAQDCGPCHQRCLPRPPPACGDGGFPPPPDGGMDGGVDGGRDGGGDGGAV